MITCKDLNIELCKGCNHPNPYCYIGHYRHFIETYCPTTRDIIKQYTSICVIKTDVVYDCFTRTLEIYHPEIFKPMILI
jgi:hypothetical protein